MFKFVMVEYVKEMTGKKSCKHRKKGSFQHLPLFTCFCFVFGVFFRGGGCLLLFFFFFFLLFVVVGGWLMVVVVIGGGFFFSPFLPVYLFSRYGEPQETF